MNKEIIKKSIDSIEEELKYADIDRTLIHKELDLIQKELDKND